MRRRGEEWRRSEETTAKYYGRLVGYSGARPTDKLDVAGEGKWEGYRFSNKWTGKGSISFKLADLEKDIKQAAMDGSQLIRIVDIQGKRFAFMQESIFQGLAND